MDYNIKTRIVIWFLTLFVGILLESLFRELLYLKGIEIIRYIQDNVSQYQKIMTFIQYLSLMATKWAIISFVLISYNFFDIYSSMIISFVGGCGSVGTGFFKLIYKNPRPFFHENWVKVYDCETGYGNPSGHSIVAVSLYLTLWKLYRHKYEPKGISKKIMNVLLYIFISILLLTRLALGAHSLNQIILGSLLGYQIHSLAFFVLKIDLNIHEEIKVFLNRSYMKLLFSIVSAILSVSIILFNFFPLTVDKFVTEWKKAILDACPNTPYSKLFDFEAYFMVAACSSLLGAYMGIYYDITYNLNSNFQKWVEMNLHENLWNKTSFFTSLQRFVLIIMILLVPFSLDLIISSHSDTNSIFIIKNLIPYFLLNFLLFGICRHVCCKLKFSNEIYENRLNKVN